MAGPRRRLLTATAGVAVLATLLPMAFLSGPAVASRTVTESYAVPADGVLRLTGHGYGHGHGMSQYGAQGAALQGLSAAQILAFYYPGTSSALTRGRIGVLIGADTDHDVRVAPASGLRVRAVGGTSYLLPTGGGIRTWRLRVVGGRTTLDYDDGTWHTYRPGGTDLTGDAEFYGPTVLTLRVAGGTRTYRGTLRLSGGSTVNWVSMNDYVRGVVPREMPASWQPAALQAQAVAARTYGAWDRAAHPTRSWQTCDSTSCQVYGGYAAEDPRSDAAVAATSRQVLLWQGAPAFTQFASSSGGWTADGGMPYLVAEADPYDGFAGNPVHTWTTSVTRAAVQRAWPSLGTLRRVRITQRDGHGQWFGRVERMTLVGSRSNVTTDGSTFRSRMGLRSSWFHFG